MKQKEIQIDIKCCNCNIKITVEQLITNSECPSCKVNLGEAFMEREYAVMFSEKLQPTKLEDYQCPLIKEGL